MTHAPAGRCGAPGQSVRVYQPGTALKMPKGAVLTVAMHYTANGKETIEVRGAPSYHDRDGQHAHLHRDDPAL